jgi:SAM-dependent methyltransferase
MIRKILAKLLISRLQWRDLRSVTPVSDSFGFDRGSPIDRYYIESFLKQNSQLITGKVLEIAESRYSKKFGNNVSAYEVLHVVENKDSTIVGDLTKSDTLPSGTIDCFICTQVFNFVFDFQKAIEGSYQVLKPGGVLLATVSGISQISRYDADRWGHYWSFYPQGISESIKKVFKGTNVSIQTYGNSLTAISFLKGIAMEELTQEELDFVDQNYPVTITIVAKKE